MLQTLNCITVQHTTATPIELKKCQELFVQQPARQPG